MKSAYPLGSVDGRRVGSRDGRAVVPLGSGALKPGTSVGLRVGGIDGVSVGPAVGFIVGDRILGVSVGVHLWDPNGGSGHATAQGEWTGAVL